MLSTQDLREILTNVENLGAVLRARRPGDSFLLKDINQRVKAAKPDGKEDLQYMTGLAVYGSALMTKERLDGIEQVNFDIDEMISRLLSLLALQHEIIIKNIENGRLILPESLSQNALYCREGGEKQ